MSDVIVVKIGTESLIDFENSEKIQRLVDAIVTKTREWVKVLFVTSGAVDFWRKTLTREKALWENKAVLAAIGWDSLLWAYRRKFKEKWIDVAGFLVTHADIEDLVERRNAFVKNIESAWEMWIIPIVNENDALSSEELEALKRWADNDKNAFLLARLFRAKQLVLITNTNGVYRNIYDENTRISAIKSDELVPSLIEDLCPKESVSKTGTGWMASKLSIAYTAWFHGIHTHIWDGIESWLHDTYSWGTNIWAYNPEVPLS
jgi:glutamate 5-kinase